jgi:hypothetical protein
MLTSVNPISETSTGSSTATSSSIPYTTYIFYGVLILAIIVSLYFLGTWIYSNYFVSKPSDAPAAAASAVAAALANSANTTTQGSGNRTSQGSGTTTSTQGSARNTQGGTRNISGSEGFQNSSVAPTDQLFLNMQPLSIKDTGFMGPYPSGLFKEEAATVSALTAGFRFLTLEIDYTEMKKDLSKFEAPGEPTLLVRNGGNLVSGNSGSIKEVADAIARNAFSPTVPNNTSPIILYLHLVRAPSAVHTPNDYLSFLSKIATELGPLVPHHLGLTPEGNFTRQNLSDQILTTPMKSLEGKVIIMCNADTSMFRKQNVSEKRYAPANDLDFWVNIQVFLENDADTNGLTQLPPQGTPSTAVLVDLKRVLSLGPQKQEAFAAAGKERYVIAMGPRITNPSATDLDTALNILGVNTVPLDIFVSNPQDLLILMKEYSNMSFKKKPSALEYIS